MTLDAMHSHRIRARIHAANRAGERHGGHWNVGHIQTAKKMIKAGRATYVAPQTFDCHAFRLKLNGSTIIAVYDPNLDGIRTVLDNRKISHQDAKNHMDDHANKEADKLLERTNYKDEGRVVYTRSASCQACLLYTSPSPRD